MLIMRGDARTVPFDPKINGQVLTPDMISDMEICVGNELTKLYSDGNVKFDQTVLGWNFRLSQEETFQLKPGKHGVIARVRFPGAEEYDVNGVYIGEILVAETYSKRVL